MNTKEKVKQSFLKKSIIDKKLLIAVDFDNTLVLAEKESKYPEEIFEDLKVNIKEFCVEGSDIFIPTYEIIKYWGEREFEFILFSCRSGNLHFPGHKYNSMNEAINYLEEKNIFKYFVSINKNHPDLLKNRKNGHSIKPVYDWLIDDKAQNTLDWKTWYMPNWCINMKKPSIYEYIKTNESY